MRKVCSEYMTKYSANRKKRGRASKIVEVDELLFVNQKNNSGRILLQQRILGGVCRDDKEYFLVQIPNRNAKTVMENIKGHVN